MSQRADETGQHDVVIVGGGLAGLIAAREVGRSGLRAVVLEARDRLGGRAWTDHRLGRDLEMGGAWVHWVQPHVWSEITRYGLEVTRGPRPREAYWLAGDRVRTGTLDAFMDLIDPGMRRVLAGTDGLVPRPDDPAAAPELAGVDGLTVQDKLDELALPEEEYRANEAAWVGHFNGPLTRGGFASALRWTAAAGGSWRLMHEASATFRLGAGTRGLVASIAADARAVADIRTASPVHRVERDSDGASVLTGDGRRIRARRVVLTLPLNILGDVEVDPPLSEAKLAASRAGSASTGVKVWIRVRGPVAPFFGYSSADHSLSVVRTEFLGADDAVLVAFGADSARIAPDDVAAVEGALRAWRDDLEVLETTGHDWMSDPYSRETWLMHRPGQLTGSLREMQRSEGPLHLAGSDHASLWAGFMDGAVESGLRAARRITAELTTDHTP